MKIKDTNFKLQTHHKPSGDQPQAIDTLYNNFQNQSYPKEDMPIEQTLLGVTGSGKTFTMANLIQKIKEPALILAPNKTLAAQLFSEFKELFPNNSVEYFVSYYDYYQPEAYVASKDLYIEKDSSINEQIDRMRHSATHALLSRKDSIIVSSVSCIYGLGSPESYRGLLFPIETNQALSRNAFLKELLKIQYKRNDKDFHQGSFRVRGDIVDVFPPYEEEHALRIEFFGDFIEEISWVDALFGKKIKKLDQIVIYPSSHYVSPEEQTKIAIESIKKELEVRVRDLKNQKLLIEAERLLQRTNYDIEIMQEMGFCSGIENYSRHFTGRKEGEAPPTLLEYFPKKFLCFIDESHVTVPQVGGMFRGDRQRKQSLVEHGFRLPSALDNRPLNFQEFKESLNKVVYVSATPGDYEIKQSQKSVVEQIIRPTGLLDPVVEVRPATHQVQDLIQEIRIRTQKKQRVLVTSLTKKSAEDLSAYYEEQNIKVKYLHSDIKTVERVEIIRDLRLGIIDVLVGINLLREGLDLPEVSLVAILDADKEGFLRSTRSLIQTIGRAARNSEGKAILYADKVTGSMERAIKETQRRRHLQESYNKKNSIIPQTIIKKVSEGLVALHSFKGEASKIESPSKKYKVNEKMEENPLRVKELEKEIKKLKKKMNKLAKDLQFEEAATLRDKIKKLEFLHLEVL